MFQSENKESITDDQLKIDIPRALYCWIFYLNIMGMGFISISPETKSQRELL